MGLITDMVLIMPRGNFQNEESSHPQKEKKMSEKGRSECSITSIMGSITHIVLIMPRSETCPELVDLCNRLVEFADLQGEEEIIVVLANFLLMYGLFVLLQGRVVGWKSKILNGTEGSERPSDKLVKSSEEGVGRR